MKKLTERLKNETDFGRKIDFYLNKDKIDSNFLRELRKFHGVGKSQQVFSKAIDIIVFNNLDLSKEIISQISYSKEVIRLINAVNIENKERNKEKSKNYFHVKVEIWKLTICLESFNSSSTLIFNSEDFLIKVINNNIDILLNLFPERRGNFGSIN